MEYLLNLQIIYEKLQELGIQAEFVPAKDMSGLKGVCFYDKDTMGPDFLIICAKQFVDTLPEEESSLVLAGEWTKEETAGRKGYIHIREYSFFHLMNHLERIFVYYKELEKRLLRVLCADSSLNEICKIGVEHFQSPVVVHDEHFYILACPEMVQGKTNFDYDMQMDSYIENEQTLTLFRTSAAYQETLKTTGGQSWKSDFDDTSCLYANIWIDQIYKGRLLVLTTEETAGKLREVGYFSGIIRQVLLNRYVYRNDAPSLLKGILIDALNGREINPLTLAKKAEKMHWQMNDAYVCGMVTFGSEKISHYLAFGVCNSIQQHIKGSYPCYYQKAIYFITNLEKGNLTINDLRMKMSYIIRESLLHVGISNVFYKLQDFPLYMKQAEIALVYSREEKRTSWYNEFRETVLAYWMIKGVGELTRESIISGDLMLLKNYDGEKGTDLYQTLKTYLTCERNSTLTAQLLDIHRSTLPHRLERIEKLTGLDLEDFSTRLYLLMSFAIEDKNLIPE